MMLKLTKMKIVALAICICVVGLVAIMIPYAQSVQSKSNSEAYEAYKKEMQQIMSEDSNVYALSYKYADIVGDSTQEVIVKYRAGGSGTYFRVYTYNQGEVECLLDDGMYGMDKMSFYKKTKSLVIYRTGHGTETYFYYKMKNGKYEQVASRARSNVEEIGPWGYWYDGKDVSYHEYKKVVDEMTKGFPKHIEDRDYEYFE